LDEADHAAALVRLPGDGFRLLRARLLLKTLFQFL
jgi:hypothetical protein